MEKKIITFGGITNVPDDGLNEAGDMSVLLNMRHKGGELVPCQPPSKDIGQLGSYTQNHDISQAVYHAQSGRWLMNVYYPGGDGTKEGRYVVIFKDGFLFDNIGPNGKASIFPKDDELETFSVMGNIVIMSCKNSVQYAIWRNGVYEFLGGLPEVPRMTIETTRRPIKVSTAPNKYYLYLTVAINQGGSAELWNNYVKKGYLDKCLDVLYKSAAFVDLANFRLAVKLFDGTYASISPIYVVNGTHGTTSNTNPAGGLQNFRWNQQNTNTTLVEYTAAVEGFIPQFTLEEYDFSKWTDIISSICLFTTGSLPLHGVGKGLKSYDGDNIISRDYEDYILLAPEDIKKQYLKNEYYKLAEFDLKGKLVHTLDNTSPSNLAVQDVLSVSNIHQNKAEEALVINSRLHINDIETLFFPGFNDVTAFGEGTVRSNVKKIVVKTYIKTQDEDITVLTEKKDVEMNVSALLTYPDPRAYKMDVYIQAGLSNGLYTLYYKEFDLVKNENGTCAYYIDSKAWDLHQVTVKSNLSYDVSVINENGLLNFAGGKSELSFTYNSNGYWTCDGYGRVDISQYFNIEGNPSSEDNFKVGINSKNPETVISFEQAFNNTLGGMPEKVLDATLIWGENSLTDFTVENKTIKEVRTNILKVSAVDNPFYFPTAQTYKFEGEIKGLASNAEAISPGQFGMFPLYVFTDTGIWAMQVDTSGQGAYTTQSPFSREVCSGAICPVSGGVVFATDKGVMAISNGQVADLSAVLDGFDADFFYYNAEMWNAIFAKARKGVVNPVPIREYIKGAVIAYNYHYNEIILSNKAKGYSYVYSLTNQVWSVIDTVFDLTTNKYPELVVFNKGGGCMYTFKDGAALNKVVAITRPFTLGSIDFKRIRQAGLRTTFNGRLNFYVLGSIDGAVFKCITGKEVDADVANPNGGTYRDLITAMSRSKQYKYFAIAIAGQMSGRVSMAELLVDAGFANNKIR